MPLTATKLTQCCFSKALPLMWFKTARKLQINFADYIYESNQVLFCTPFSHLHFMLT